MGQGYQATNMFWLVLQDKDEACPEGAEEADQPDHEAEEGAWRHKVAQSFGTQKAGESVAFHGLECVVFCRIKNFWVVAAMLFNGGGNVV